MNQKIPFYLKGADYFIMASKDEGMSNALLEAMASGLCPVVPAKTSGMKDLIRHRISGILYDLNDIESLVEELKTVSRKEAGIIGKEARNSVRKLCDIKKVVSKHIKFYEDKISKSN
jgi:glycosyltransferase involved in cell wall biosynthesis